MSLSERIQKDLVDAMRAKDELRLSVLRGMKAAIKHKEVEKIRALDEAESIQILQTLVKQRKESIEQFSKGNRPELAEKESNQAEVLRGHVGSVVKEGLGHHAAEIEDHAVELTSSGDRLGGCLRFSHRLHCA